MRAAAAIALLCGLPPLSFGAKLLTTEDKVELIRGLNAEYATVKVLLPRARKPLEFESAGSYDKRAWAAIAKESGPAARTGDSVQITKVDFEADRIVLQINGGFRGGRKWYDGVSIGMGPSMNPAQVPVGTNDSNAPGGTSLAILFHKPLEPIKSAEIKKMLADRKSVV